MTGLGNLLKLQAQKKSSEAQGTSSAARENAAVDRLIAAVVATPTMIPAEPEVQVALPVVAAAPKTGIMRLGALKAAAPPPPPATVRPATPVTETIEFSLDDIAGMDSTMIPANTASSDPVSSWFSDEIEATAPERVIPEDINANQLGFIESLDSIYQTLNDPDMFGQQVRLIMMELQENPEYVKLVADQDVHVMIRAMRNTMGLARIRKQEKSRKAGTGKAATVRAKKSAVSESDMSLLNNLLGGMDMGED